MRFTPPWNELRTENAQVLGKDALRCDRVYDVYVVNGISAEGLSELICTVCISIGARKIM